MVSIFARWRSGHQKATLEPPSKGISAPYRHVPTHALSDALAGVPGSYRAADHAKIREQQRQRSAQTSIGGSEVAALAPTSRSPSYLGLSANERTPFKHKAHLRTERGESYLSRSRLSNVGMEPVSLIPHASTARSSFTETSPHISGANSESSIRVSSSQQSSSTPWSDSSDHL